MALDPGSGRTRPGAGIMTLLRDTLSLAPMYADDDATALPNPARPTAGGAGRARDPGIYEHPRIIWEGALPTVFEDVLPGPPRPP